MQSLAPNVKSIENCKNTFFSINTWIIGEMLLAF